MRASHDHILTSHAGSLPRPDELIEAWAQAAGGAIDQDAFAQRLRAAVAEVVRRQRDLGVGVPGDGEFGKPMAQRVNYGSWWRYSWSRLGGLDPGGPSLYEMVPRGHGPRRRSASLRFIMSATMQSGPTSPISRPRCRPPGSRRAS